MKKDEKRWKKMKKNTLIFSLFSSSKRRKLSNFIIILPVMANKVFLLFLNALIILHISFLIIFLVFNGFIMFIICVVKRNGMNSGTWLGEGKNEKKRKRENEKRRKREKEKRRKREKAKNLQVT